MNKEQKDRLEGLTDERQPGFRVTVIDTDGSLVDIALTQDLAEATNIIENYYDAIGIVVIFEVIQ